MNLLLLEPSELQGKDGARLSVERSRHVREVLRAKVGQRLRVGVRDGNRGSAVVEDWDEGALVLGQVVTDEPPPPRAGLGLLLALPRPKALRRVLQAVAALGLDHLVLVNAARVDKAYWDSPILDSTTIRHAFDLGLEQAEDTRTPGFRLEPRFRPFVEDVLPTFVSPHAAWVLDPRAETSFSQRQSNSAQVSWVAVGPETGWTEFELGLLTAAGLQPISLGPRVLRTETVVPFIVGALHR